MLQFSLPLYLGPYIQAGPIWWLCIAWLHKNRKPSCHTGSLFTLFSCVFPQTSCDYLWAHTRINCPSFFKTHKVTYLILLESQTSLISNNRVRRGGFLYWIDQSCSQKLMQTHNCIQQDLPLPNISPKLKAVGRLRKWKKRKGNDSK